MSMSWKTDTSQGHKSFASGTFPDSALCVSSFGWPWLVSFCYKKLYSVFLSSMSCPSELSNLRRWWEPLYLSQRVRSMGGLGTPNLQLVPEVRVICRGLCP